MSPEKNQELLRRGNRRGTDSRPGPHPGASRRGSHLGLRAEGQGARRPRDRPDAERRRRARGQHPGCRQQASHHRAADQRGRWLSPVVRAVRPGRGRHLRHPGRALALDRGAPEGDAPRRGAGGSPEAVDRRPRGLQPVPEGTLLPGAAAARPAPDGPATSSRRRWPSTPGLRRPMPASGPCSPCSAT